MRTPRESPREEAYYEALLDVWDIVTEQTVPSRSWSAEKKVEWVAERVTRVLETKFDDD
jgi:hypothetical protein